jgi:1,2-dihydroxy-3-keto-5-methylthiopentene dioxygenase
MAILRLTDGTIYRDLVDIDRELAPLNIQLKPWPVGDNPQLLAILNQNQLSENDKNSVLSHLDHYFEQLKASGYQSRDLIAINSTIPGLDDMLAKFDRCHTHTDDEVRYIVAGEGIFGFVRPDKTQVELIVQAAEYINVPAGTEHWFYLTPNRRVIALRYFIDTSGWTPEYTNTPILFRTAVAAK